MWQDPPGNGVHFPTQKSWKEQARSDGIRAIFLVPTAYTVGYWKGLRAYATAQMELTSPKAEFHNPQGTMGNRTLFLVDFSEADSSSAAACAQEHLRRGRRQRLSPVELEERSRTDSNKS